MDAYFICAFSRPQNAELVLTNYRRQNYQKKHLVVIENGDGLNQFPRVWDKNITVLQSPKHQSIARNTGLNHVASIAGKKCWLTLDDDDTYGSCYMPETIWFAEQYPDFIIGKHRHWIKTKTLGTFLYRHPKENYLHGATLASTCFNYRFPVVKIDEDFALVNYFKEKNISTSFNHYCWIRNNFGRGHTFGGTDYMIFHMNKIAKKYTDLYLPQMNNFTLPIGDL